LPNLEKSIQLRHPKDSEVDSGNQAQIQRTEEEGADRPRKLKDFAANLIRFSHATTYLL
jgi:hypothetical protein